MSEITTEITIQDGVVKQVVRLSESVQISDTNEAIIKVVEANESEDEFDTYPEPDANFVYEDPYVTADEMNQIRGNNEVKRPRKPASGYFYFAKSLRYSLQRQHPTWPMKRIISAIASQWSKKSDSEREPFLALAKADSDRYKRQMAAFASTDAYKAAEKKHKKWKRQKAARLKEAKASLDHDAAFELFCKDHGGSLQAIRQLWRETDPATKAEYDAKLTAKNSTQTRSRRVIKLPARLADNMYSQSRRSPLISKSQPSLYDNYLSVSKSRFPNKDQGELKAEWEAMAEEEKKKFANPMSVSYKALADGDLFFDLDDKSTKPEGL